MYNNNNNNNSPLTPRGLPYFVYNLIDFYITTLLSEFSVFKITHKLCVRVQILVLVVFLNSVQLNLIQFNSIQFRSIGFIGRMFWSKTKINTYINHI